MSDAIKTLPTRQQTVAVILVINPFVLAFVPAGYLSTATYCATAPAVHYGVVRA